MDEDCIVISDDEDVQYIKHVVNLEPVTIDLTKNDTPQSERRQNSQSFDRAESHDHSMEHEGFDESEESERMEGSDEPESPEEAEQQQDESEREEEPTQPGMAEEAQQQNNEQEQDYEHDHEHDQSEEPSQSNIQNGCQTSEEPQQIEETERPETIEEPEQPQRVETPAKPPEKPRMSDHELMIATKTLGNEKYRHNLFDDAIRTYKRANQLAKQLGDNEMSAILHFNLAMTYYKLGSYDQAADECANAVKINDKYMKAHLKRAEIYLRQCKYEEAVICYEHICDLDNSNRDYAILLKQARDRVKLTKKKDYLKILGLSVSFTKDDLKRAYRQKALSHHPDRHSDADIVTRKIEEKRFKEASEAHSFIQLKYGYTR